MTAPILYHVPASRSFRVLWMLHELGEPPEIVTHDIAQGTMRDADFMARSPAARAPALDIDGLRLFESGAILEYLAETRGRFGRAPGDAERVAYLQWIHFAETQAAHLQVLNLSHVFLRDPAQRSQTVQKIEARRLEMTVAAVDRALDGRDWLLEGGFSAADMMLGFNLFAVPRYVAMEGFGNLAAYRDRIEARPAYRSARAADGEQKFYDRDFYAWDR